MPEIVYPVHPIEGAHGYIPDRYRSFWTPYRTKKVLFHLTTKVNLEQIMANGYIEPRDPSPKHWAGMKAVFLSDPDDPFYAESVKHVLGHVQEKHRTLVRLGIITDGDLFKSTDPARTFQVISTEPISTNHIVAVEEF